MTFDLHYLLDLLILIRTGGASASLVLRIGAKFCKKVGMEAKTLPRDQDRTWTDGKRLGRQLIQRVPSSDGVAAGRNEDVDDVKVLALVSRGATRPILRPRADLCVGHVTKKDELDKFSFYQSKAEREYE